ncbi:MAG TPA: preprotein translocase subunit SecY [Caulobacteraceae bacterium]|jgi:preprotein translocase subunit SecY
MASAAEQLAANINFGAFRKATELHKRLLFTVGALIVYRFGTFIPCAGVNTAAFAKTAAGSGKGIFDTFNLFSGGAVQHMAIFALNVMPYISASIIVQLLQSIYPPWEKLKKEGGEAGRKQLNQYTRYLTVVLALAQSFGIAIGLQNSPGVVSTTGPYTGIFFLTGTIATLTGGTLFLMWLGEQVTSRGVGNGNSLIIFAGIVSRLPTTVGNMLGNSGKSGGMSPVVMLAIAAGAIGLLVFVVFMERAQRRLLVQYPKRQVGNRMFGGESSFLPLKVNTSGVIPPIFASSLLLLPTTAMAFVAGSHSKWASWLQPVTTQLQHGQPLFILFYAVLIIFFCFFYTSVVFDPKETAENLRKYGGFLPGIRPGARTAEYLDYVLTRLTAIGALYVMGVCLIPEFITNVTAIQLGFTGTSILIVVSVMMDTVAQIQSHLLAHQYEGLIKKSKLRGGRGR